MIRKDVCVAGWWLYQPICQPRNALWFLLAHRCCWTCFSRHNGVAPILHTVFGILKVRNPLRLTLTISKFADCGHNSHSDGCGFVYVLNTCQGQIHFIGVRTSSTPTIRTWTCINSSLVEVVDNGIYLRSKQWSRPGPLTSYESSPQCDIRIWLPKTRPPLWRVPKGYHHFCALRRFYNHVNALRPLLSITFVLHTLSSLWIRVEQTINSDLVGRRRPCAYRGDDVDNAYVGDNGDVHDSEARNIYDCSDIDDCNCDDDGWR